MQLKSNKSSMDMVADMVLLLSDGCVKADLGVGSGVQRTPGKTKILCKMSIFHLACHP
jgi:hypothetical protein